MPIACHSLLDLSEQFGNPPQESLGLFCAVQALLYNRDLVYFRVNEEGFSIADYRQGLSLLRNRELPQSPTAICMPGMGDPCIIDETSELCFIFHSLLITSEKDFYDYLSY